MLLFCKHSFSIGANTIADDDYDLRWASLIGHLEVVKYLVSLGANMIDEFET